MFRVLMMLQKAEGRYCGEWTGKSESLQRQVE